MGYKAVFLDGTNGLPYVECEVCKRLGRNVIEPVVLFVEERDGSLLLSHNDIKIILQKNKSEKLECIFHCEKENEIWIENFKKDCRKKNKKSIDKKECFSEEIPPFKWNENLVQLFWQRIRAYKKAVDLKSGKQKAQKNEKDENKVLDENLLVEWYKNKLKKSIPYEKYKGNELSLLFGEILDKDEIEEFYYYDFIEIIFPKFEFDSNEKLISEGERVFAAENLNFWFRDDYLSFNNQVFFNKAKFLDIVRLTNTTFYEIVYFSDTTFYKKVFFKKSNFYNDTWFLGSTFFNQLFFDKSKFNYIDFSGSLFCHDIHFRDAHFNSLCVFGAPILKGNSKELTGSFFKKNVYFSGSIFEKLADFTGCVFEGRKIIFSFCKIKEKLLLKEVKFLEQKERKDEPELNFKYATVDGILEIKEKK